MLVGGLEHEFYFSIQLGMENNHPNWLSYFSEAFKAPTSMKNPHHLAQPGSPGAVSQNSSRSRVWRGRWKSARSEEPPKRCWRESNQRTPIIGFMGGHMEGHEVFLRLYPLVNVYITMENNHVTWETPHYKWAIFNSGFWTNCNFLDIANIWPWWTAPGRESLRNKRKGSTFHS